MSLLSESDVAEKLLLLEKLVIRYNSETQIITELQVKKLSSMKRKIVLKKKLELELYFFYLNTVNLSDKIIILKITIYFNLYKHGLKI